MKTLKCDYCDDTTDFPDDTEITGYLCEKMLERKDEYSYESGEKMTLLEVHELIHKLIKEKGKDYDTMRTECEIKVFLN